MGRAILPAAGFQPALAAQERAATAKIGRPTGTYTHVIRLQNAACTLESQVLLFSELRDWVRRHQFVAGEMLTRR